MRISIKSIDSSGQVTETTANITGTPDECPVCHRGMTPQIIYSWRDKHKGYTGPSSHKTLQILYRCPMLSCRNLFITFYKATSSSLESFSIVRSLPNTFVSTSFGEKIKSISPSFEEVYNQAASAESQQLMQICGPGYRKALEFLIKDYLIYLNQENEEDIKKEFLGKSIKDRVTSETIKAVSERAVWLGNDETHYTRKWGDKDLGDLKKLIQATVHWIEQEELAKDILAEMPDPTASPNNELEQDPPSNIQLD